MTPDEVASIYSKQALMLEKLINNLKNNKYSNQEYESLLLYICQQYYELLKNLAAFTPLLTAYQVKFHKINSLESKMNLSEPPFEKDFFNYIKD